MGLQHEFLLAGNFVTLFRLDTEPFLSLYKCSVGYFFKFVILFARLFLFIIFVSFTGMVLCCTQLGGTSFLSLVKSAF